MLKKDPWWLFVLIFAGMVLGIQTLGWWSQPPALPAHVIPTKQGTVATPAELRFLQCQPKHWRTMVMQQ